MLQVHYIISKTGFFIKVFVKIVDIIFQNMKKKLDVDVEGGYN